MSRWRCRTTLAEVLKANPGVGIAWLAGRCEPVPPDGHVWGLDRRASAMRCVRCRRFLTPWWRRWWWRVSRGWR